MNSNGRRRRAGLYVAALVLAAALGAAFGSGAFGLRDAVVTPAGAMEPADREAVEAAKNMSRAFTAVAREVVPSVVTVTSSRVIRPAQSLGPNGGDMEQFFRFFGQPRSPWGGEEEMVQRGLGSGVIATEDGYIITNNHVVADARDIAVLLSNGEEYEAEVIGADPKTDVAVIRIDAKGLPAARFGDSDALEVGEWVIAVGSPFSQSLNHTVTTGIVSAKSRTAVGLADYEDFIQTDAAINPGNSGGALVNLDGEVVGINTAIASRSGGSQGVGFAIPINMARRIQSSLIETGTVTRGWIGIGIQGVTKEIQEALDLPDRDGVLVSNIMEKSPAEEAGLERQDVIVRLNGRKVDGMRTFRNEIASTPPGTNVDLGVLRDGKERTLSLELGRMPGDDESPRVASEKSEERLGLEVRPITQELRRSFELDRGDGVVVVNVRRGSAAARNGIREGDVILEVNREEIETVADYGRALDGLETGDVALLLVERQGNTFYVAVRLPE
ncbi:MAG: Do family serine endopeptidase [Candidatus Eisenbacteria bacterium]|nr:Do family serine endopeptidase [Candidatus Eisenbacteria bacterium]